MHTLSLYHDVLAAKEGAVLSAANRVLFLVAGAATIRAGGQAVTLAPNSAWHGSGSAAVSAGTEGATIARFELVRAGAPGARPQLAADMALDAADGYLMRCDKVSFPLGGIAYTHTHQGAGSGDCSPAASASRPVAKRTTWSPAARGSSRARSRCSRSLRTKRSRASCA